MPVRPRSSVFLAGLLGAGVVGGTVALSLSREMRRSFGAGRRAIALSASGSPQFTDDAFSNRLPSSEITSVSMATVATQMLRRDGRGKPREPVAVAVPEFPEQPAPLAATWLGHASVLLEIDGHRVLADPMFADRASPSRLAGPRRLHPNPLTVQELPPLDAIVISHDHYDHLDVGTVEQLTRLQAAPFLVPLGIGAHLRRWGVPDERIVELDWDGEQRVGDLTITCTEARHFSGRLFRRNATLWSSWVIAGPQHRVFFGGDTGYTPAFAEIGARFNGFDLTVLPIGAYGDLWPDIHLNPEQAARAHGDLGGKVLLPIHWATFDLAFHPWSEPIDRLLAAAAESGHQVLLPAPGARIDTSTPASGAPSWWLSSVEPGTNQGNRVPR